METNHREQQRHHSQSLSSLLRYSPSLFLYVHTQNRLSLFSCPTRQSPLLFLCVSRWKRHINHLVFDLRTKKRECVISSKRECQSTGSRWTELSAIDIWPESRRPDWRRQPPDLRSLCSQRKKHSKSIKTWSSCQWNGCKSTTRQTSWSMDHQRKQQRSTWQIHRPLFHDPNLSPLHRWKGSRNIRQRSRQQHINSPCSSHGRQWHCPGLPRRYQTYQKRKENTCLGNLRQDCNCH